jgi:hypothetical protein
MLTDLAVDETACSLPFASVTKSGRGSDEDSMPFALAYD